MAKETDRHESELPMTPEIEALGLEKYARELDRDGLTIVPPEVNGFGMDRIDRIVERILDRAHEMTGVRFTLEDGPVDALEFPRPDLPPEAIERLKAMNILDAILNPTQFLIQKLTQVDRIFRDLVLNPASMALQNYLMAGRTRLSSANCFVKWKGDFGYGPGLGLHADQAEVPRPWGAVAHTANSTWCLTDYTHAGGALAYIPGSHREGLPAPPPERVQDAIPAEAPKGSVIVWHGATWHGAFPRKQRKGHAPGARGLPPALGDPAPGGRARPDHRGDGGRLRQSRCLSGSRRVERQVPVQGAPERGRSPRRVGATLSRPAGRAVARQGAQSPVLGCPGCLGKRDGTSPSPTTVVHGTFAARPTTSSNCTDS